MGPERLNWHQLGPKHSGHKCWGRNSEKGSRAQNEGGFEGKLQGEKLGPAHDVV